MIIAIYGRSLVNKSTRKIVKLHRFARHVDVQVLPIAQTLPIVGALDRLPLSPATVDIAELHRHHQATPATSWEDLPRPARQHPRHRRPAGHDRRRPLRLRRIGRLLARLMNSLTGQDWFVSAASCTTNAITPC